MQTMIKRRHEERAIRRMFPQTSSKFQKGSTQMTGGDNTHSSVTSARVNVQQLAEYS